MGKLECACCGDVGAVVVDPGVYFDGQELVCGCPGHVSCCAESEPYVLIDDSIECVPCLLRARVAELEGERDGLKAEHTISEALLQDGAKTIERLEAERETNALLREKTRGALERADATIERLRGALEHVSATIPHQHCGSCNTTAGIARRALAPDAEKGGD